jgi:hypothetical protein
MHWTEDMKFLSFNLSRTNELGYVAKELRMCWKESSANWSFPPQTYRNMMFVMLLW